MTDAGTSGPKAGGTPRWLLAVVFASLAFNLIVVGVVAGAMWRFRGPEYLAAAVTPNLLGYASTLPAERRRALWDATAEERRRVRPFRREVRAAREETVKAFSAEPFDKQRFLAAQEKQTETERRAREAVRHLYIKLADELTAEERRAYPQWRAHRRRPTHNLLDEPADASVSR
jgi:uncharacterized membrane protein